MSDVFNITPFVSTQNVNIENNEVKFSTITEDPVIELGNKSIHNMRRRGSLNSDRDASKAVNNLREKGIEANNYDVLDAIIYLEKKGKVKAPEVTDYTTEQAQQTSTEFEQAQQEYTRDCNKKTFGQMMDQFFSWCGRLLKKSVDSKFIIERRGSTMVNVPVLVLILAIIFAF